MTTSTFRDYAAELPEGGQVRRRHRHRRRGHHRVRPRGRQRLGRPRPAALRAEAARVVTTITTVEWVAPGGCRSQRGRPRWMR